MLKPIPVVAKVPSPVWEEVSGSTTACGSDVQESTARLRHKRKGSAIGEATYETTRRKKLLRNAGQCSSCLWLEIGTGGQKKTFVARNGL
mmetsp:Transcript_74380/g.149728  ORF Transcript_74380/g.149728 Transcript_74380/m.149728 type:complete len:90 (+) Transcript_74380:2397-2666(+)